MSAREPVVDALRALALFGVLVVNLQSYPDGPWSSPLALATPEGSAAAQWARAGVAWLVQGKAYPMLAFLFGYSLALSARVHAFARRQRRLGRLLALGLLHGLLLYAGDILTLYAVLGLLLLHAGPFRWHTLRQWLRASLALALGLLLLHAWWAFGASGMPADDAWPTYASARGWADHFELNAVAFLSSLVTAPLLYAPEVLMLMLAGLAAGRLRLLTHRRWRTLRARLVRTVLPLGLALNAVYAWWMTVTPAPPQGEISLAELLAAPAGWCLAAGYVALVARAWTDRGTRRLLWLAPLGRYTLSLYVGLSAGAALLLNGAGLAWPAGSVALLAAAALTWLAAAALAQEGVRRGWRGPLERWVGSA